MRVAVTGASGLIGRPLVASLRAGGHDVLRLVRRAPRASDEVGWDPAGDVDLTGLRGTDAVVHLAGAGVGDHRWTAAYKETVLRSRVDGTTTIARAVAALDPRPRVLVSGSAVGAYGDRGEEELTEDSPYGEGFLAGVVRAWEAATAPAQDAAVRVVHARTGLVMARGGGAFGRTLPLFRLGLGGPLGRGRQWWSWITLADEVRALTFLLGPDEASQQAGPEHGGPEQGGRLHGPVNLTAPHPARNAEVTAALGRALRRPAMLPVPAPVLRVALGELASDVLASQRVLPARLQAAGFTFSSPGVDDGARWLAAQRR